VKNPNIRKHKNHQYAKGKAYRSKKEAELQEQIQNGQEKEVRNAGNRRKHKESEKASAEGDLTGPQRL